MAKYKVSFRGFAYIEADSEDEAKQSLENEECVYLEYDAEAEEVDEFVVKI